MNLSSYSDVSRQLAKNTCECGRRKANNVEACDRCRFLDGGKIRPDVRVGTADVISVLRGTDGLSLREMCEALGIDNSLNNGQRGLHRHAMSLLRKGRVRRYWRDGDTFEREERPFGNSSRRVTRGFGGCWVYILDGAAQ